jgi:hypothetical protein
MDVATNVALVLQTFSRGAANIGFQCCVSFLTFLVEFAGTNFFIAVNEDLLHTTYFAALAFSKGCNFVCMVLNTFP